MSVFLPGDGSQNQDQSSWVDLLARVLQMKGSAERMTMMFHDLRLQLLSRIRCQRMFQPFLWLHYQTRELLALLMASLIQDQDDDFWILSLTWWIEMNLERFEVKFFNYLIPLQRWLNPIQEFECKVTCFNDEWDRRQSRCQSWRLSRWSEAELQMFVLRLIAIAIRWDCDSRWWRRGFLFLLLQRESRSWFKRMTSFLFRPVERSRRMQVFKIAATTSSKDSSEK